MKVWIPYILLFNLLIPNCEFGNPHWSDCFDPTFYQFSATLTAAEVYIDGQLKSTGHLAAFISGETRGLDVDGPSLFPPSGTNIWEVSLYSNQLSGEMISFKYYDDVNDIVIDLDETIEFSSDDIIADASSPFIFTGTMSNCDNFDFFPSLFTFSSSSSQAFYYISDAYIDNIHLDNDDWIGAFNGNVCVGARQWDTDTCQGGVCGLAVMGQSSIDNETCNYMQFGEIPSFKIYDKSEDIYYNASINSSNNLSWESDANIMIDSLNDSGYYCDNNPSCSGCTDPESENYNSDAIINDGSCLHIDSQIIPYNFELIQNYPNPFNPITTINFSVPYYSLISVNIYDISGKLIETLTNNYYNFGLHQLYWDASNFPSGVYIYKLKTDNYLISKKMLLIK